MENEENSKVIVLLSNVAWGTSDGFTYETLILPENCLESIDLFDVGRVQIFRNREDLAKTKMLSIAERESVMKALSKIQSA